MAQPDSFRSPPLMFLTEPRKGSQQAEVVLLGAGLIFFLSAVLLWADMKAISLSHLWVTLALSAPLVIAMPICILRRSRRLARLFREHIAQRSSDDLLAAIETNADVRDTLDRALAANGNLAVRLVRAGHKDIAIWVKAKQDESPVDLTPSADHFDPIPLKDAAGNPGPLFTASMTTAPHERFSQRASRLAQSPKPMAVIFICLGLLMLVLDLFMREPGSGLKPFPFFFLALGLVNLLGHRVMQKSPVCISPGVIFRRWSIGTKAVDSYRRESSVLIWRPAKQMLTAASGFRKMDVLATPAEAAAAFRAWLSPAQNSTNTQVRSCLDVKEVSDEDSSTVQPPTSPEVIQGEASPRSAGEEITLAVVGPLDKGRILFRILKGIPVAVIMAAVTWVVFQGIRQREPEFAKDLPPGFEWVFAGVAALSVFIPIFVDLIPRFFIRRLVVSGERLYIESLGPLSRSIELRNLAQIQIRSKGTLMHLWTDKGIGCLLNKPVLFDHTGRASHATAWLSRFNRGCHFLIPTIFDQSVESLAVKIAAIAKSLQGQAIPIRHVGGIQRGLRVTQEHGRLLPDIGASNEDRPAAVVVAGSECTNCGYDLRDLSDMQACPECGIAVALSLRGVSLDQGHPTWLRALRRGASLLLLAAVLELLAVPWLWSATMDRLLSGSSNPADLKAGLALVAWAFVVLCAGASLFATQPKIDDYRLRQSKLRKLVFGSIFLVPVNISSILVVSGKWIDLLFAALALPFLVWGATFLYASVPLSRSPQVVTRWACMLVGLSGSLLGFGFWGTTLVRVYFGSAIARTAPPPMSPQELSSYGLQGLTILLLLVVPNLILAAAIRVTIARASSRRSNTRPMKHP